MQSAQLCTVGPSSQSSQCLLNFLSMHQLQQQKQSLSDTTVVLFARCVNSKSNHTEYVKISSVPTSVYS